MKQDFSNVPPSEIQLLKTLHHTEKSIVHLVHINEHQYAMKIHRGQEPPEEAPTSWQTCFLTERDAYEHLDAKGLTQKGVVPRYFGSRERLEPGLWTEFLADYEGDIIRPDAIFLEYVPNILKFWDVNPDTKATIQLMREIVTPDRQDRLIKLFGELLDAGVIYDDLNPRNITITADDRVLWLDLDTAQLRPVDDALIPGLEWVKDKKAHWDNIFARERVYIRSFFNDINEAIENDDWFTMRKYQESWF